ncbi:MAG: amidohydrolase [Deltaproteobacteria bacterium]|nr:amidohydrolase [Deltaproteobacteria bacterium]
MNDGLLADLEAEIPGMLDALRAVRHDLHRHPELGFEEHRTQGVVRRWLESNGYRPAIMAETGLVADLRPSPTDHEGSPVDPTASTSRLTASATTNATTNAAPTTNAATTANAATATKTSTKTIALRADLDALPITEETDLPYASVYPGRSHKCGHDGHTTILLGTAAVLARHRVRIPGNVRLLFQPAEEGVRGGGAKVMIDEGALVGVDEVYGLHNWPAFPRGQVHVKPGATMAQVHNFKLVFRGVGGHGSQPQLCKDPVLAGAHFVTAVQSIASRTLGYEGGAVVSVCVFQAGRAENVIPAQATLEGTIRTFDPKITARVLARFREIAASTAATFDVRADLALRVGYPVLVNASACAAAVERVATRVVGATHLSSAGLPLAAGEDFAYFAANVPSAYFFLGAQVPGEDTPVCHHPMFDFDDSLIEIGMRMMLGLVVDRLTSH